MEQKQTIAIVVIIVVIAGAVAGYMIMFPPIPPGGTIIMGTTDSVEASIDMAQSYDYFGWEIITALSSGLVEIEPGSAGGADDIMPALAESWLPSDGGKQWDFTLREGLTFEDGTAFNASVVKYTFDRNCNLTGTGLQEPDGPQWNMGYADIIDSVVIISDYVVRFNLHIAFAPFLQLMSCAASYMVHPSYAPLDHFVEYTAGDVRGSHPNGLGPFILANWTRVGGEEQQMRLEKNPNYWNGPEYPKADVIIIQFYSSDTALTSAMAGGDIDIAYRHMSAAQIDAFRENADVRVWDGIGAAIQYMCFQQDIYPFNETDIRQGIAAALNKSHVCELVFLGNADPLETIVPDGMEYHKPSFEIYGTGANYSHTVDMFALHGYSTTNKLEFDLYYESSGHYPQSAEQAAVYKTDLEASGVMTVTLKHLEWGAYRDQRNAGTMPVYVYGWYPDYIDADNYAFLPFASWLNMGFNETYPAAGIEEYNLWVDGRSATTDALRQAAYYDLQDLQAEQCSMIPLWQGRTVAVTSPSIHGVVLDITVSWRHWLVYWGAPATTGP